MADLAKAAQEGFQETAAPSWVARPEIASALKESGVFLDDRDRWAALDFQKAESSYYLGRLP